MPEFTEDLILAAIAAASAIIGVILGARLSKKTDLTLKKEKKKLTLALILWPLFSRQSTESKQTA